MENIPVCSMCGGVCCKSSGGLVFPEDLTAGSDDLKKKLILGIYAVDVYDKIDSTQNNKAFYYVRLAQKGSGNLFDPYSKGECILLDSRGCRLTHDERPKGCRELVPNPPNCYFPNNLNAYQCAIAWMPYYDLLEEIIRGI